MYEAASWLKFFDTPHIPIFLGASLSAQFFHSYSAHSRVDARVVGMRRSKERLSEDSDIKFDRECARTKTQEDFSQI